MNEKFTEIIEYLRVKGIYKDEWGTWKLLPRRKGEVFGYKRDDGKVKKFRYSKRVKFIPSDKLKDELCK